MGIMKGMLRHWWMAGRKEQLLQDCDLKTDRTLIKEIINCNNNVLE
jgi:hypothetical protein